MNVPDTITIFIAFVCVWRGAENPAGNLMNAPYAPFVWSPHRSAIWTPGAPFGSRSIHFTSAAGMNFGAFAPAFGALFAFASPAPCARTATASTNDTANTRTFLALIKPPLLRVFRRGYHRTPRPFSRCLRIAKAPAKDAVALSLARDTQEVRRRDDQDPTDPFAEVSAEILDVSGDEVR